MSDQFDKEYAIAQEKAKSDAAYKKEKGFLRGKSNSEVQMYIQKRTHFYLQQMRPKQKKNYYEPSMESYLQNFESNNMY
jgi:hypothetical protein